MRGWPIVALCVTLAVAFFALGALYLLVETSFLADRYGHHYKHAILMLGLGVLSVVAASYARPRQA
jgi:hypothetical protein